MDYLVIPKNMGMNYNKDSIVCLFRVFISK